LHAPTFCRLFRLSGAHKYMGLISGNL
jgi:hypothetical protein